MIAVQKNLQVSHCSFFCTLLSVDAGFPAH